MRWLRAQRPPFQWFFEQPELVQETLAKLGDDHALDLIQGFASAAAHPQALVDGLEATHNPEAEDRILRRGILDLIGTVMQRQAPTAPPKPPATMGGMGERKATKAAAGQAKKDDGRSFMGRRPDLQTPARNGTQTPGDTNP